MKPSPLAIKAAKAVCAVIAQGTSKPPAIVSLDDIAKVIEDHFPEYDNYVDELIEVHNFLAKIRSDINSLMSS